MVHSEANPVDTPGIGHDDPEPQATWFIGLAGAVVFTALVLAISVFFYSARELVTEEVVVNVPSRQREVLKSEQLALISQFGRYQETLPDGQTVQRTRIPITEAMAIVVREGTLSGDSNSQVAGSSSR